MTALAALCGVCALVIVVLAYLVGRLQGDVRRLADEVARLQDRDEVAVPRSEPSASAGSTAEVVDLVVAEVLPQRAGAADLSSAQGDGVAVITAISDPADDLDVTRARVASVTLARPLIRVASLSFGVRRALGDEHRFRMRYAMHQELRRQTKMRRRRRAGKAPSKGRGS